MLTIMVPLWVLLLAAYFAFSAGIYFVATMQKGWNKHDVAGEILGGISVFLVGWAVVVHLKIMDSIKKRQAA